MKFIDEAKIEVVAGDGGNGGTGGQSATGVAHVAVAGTEISLGQRISPELVKLVDWPSGSVPRGSVDDPSKLSGRVVRNALQPGEFVEALLHVGGHGGRGLELAGELVDALIDFSQKYLTSPR